MQSITFLSFLTAIVCLLEACITLASEFIVVVTRLLTVMETIVLVLLSQTTQQNSLVTRQEDWSYIALIAKHLLSTFTQR